MVSHSSGDFVIFFLHRINGIVSVEMYRNFAFQHKICGTLFSELSVVCHIFFSEETEGGGGVADAE